MPILKIPVENPDELLDTAMLGAGALGRVERSATGGGAGFSEITTFALVAGTRLYTVYDSSGSVGSYYRVRYSKSGGTSPTPYSDEWQSGDELGGYLCSIYDVQQRLVQSGSALNNDEQEIALECIAEVSDYIANVTGRQFAPDPLSGDRTIRLHTRWGRALWVPKGIRSITTLGIASTDQPSSGGTYTTAAATAYYIDPPEYERAPGWPGTWIVLSQTLLFYDAAFGAEITGAFGFAAVPPAIQAVALNLVVGAWRARAAAGSSGITLNVDGSRTWEPMLTNKDKATLALFSRGPML